MKNAIEGILKGLIKGLFGTGYFKSCQKILGGEILNTYGIKDIMGTVLEITKGVGTALLVMFFILEMMERMTREQWDVENAIRMFIKYIFAKMILIDNIGTFLNGFIDIGSSLVSITGDVSIELSDDMINKFIPSDSNVLMSILYIVMMLIPYLLCLIVQTVLKALCYARLFEIVIYGGFSPIGMVSMVQEGFSGHGLRYMKRFMSVCFKGAILMIILVIGGQLEMATFSTFISGEELASRIDVSIIEALGMSLGTLVIPITMLGVSMRASQFANDIAGG